MSAKVAKYDVECQVSSNRHGVGAHQAAGNVIGVGKYRLNSGSVCIVNDGKDLLSQLVWEVLKNICNVIIVKLMNDRGECLWLHVDEEAVS